MHTLSGLVGEEQIKSNKERAILQLASRTATLNNMTTVLEYLSVDIYTAHNIVDAWVAEVLAMPLLDYNTVPSS